MFAGQNNIFKGFGRFLKEGDIFLYNLAYNFASADGFNRYILALPVSSNMMVKIYRSITNYR